MTVTFDPGKTAKQVKSSITGEAGVDYLLAARQGQVLQVLFSTSKGACYVNVWEPGTSGTAVHIGPSAGNEFGASPTKAGTYRIQVYQMRASARRHETCSYTISFELTGEGKGAAMPVQVRGLQGIAVACSGALDCPGITFFTNRYRYTRRAVRPIAFVASATTGRIAIEGRPVGNDVPGYTCPDAVSTATGISYINIPVRSAVANFTLFPSDPSASAIVPDPRRQVVDINKCQLCHDGGQHGDVVVPRLSLHGGNRNENLRLCVVCHNPNQTDVPYRRLTAGTTLDPRISGPETPIDFKTMVHSIHSGGFRTKPLVIVGYGSSVNDFSDVRFPLAELRNCMASRRQMTITRRHSR